MDGKGSKLQTPRSSETPPPAASFQRIAGICGIAAPIVSFSTILISVALSPWFSWTSNALSDLGVSSVAAIFNTGLVLAGALNLVFALGVRKMLTPSRVGNVGSALLFAVGVLSILVAIVTEQYMFGHIIVSLATFILTPISFLMIGAALIEKGSRLIGLITAALALGALLAIFGIPRQGWATPEIVFGVLLASLPIGIGAKMLISTKTQHVSSSLRVASPAYQSE